MNEHAKRVGEQVAKSVDVSRPAETVKESLANALKTSGVAGRMSKSFGTAAVGPKFTMPAVENLQRIQVDSAERRQQMNDALESLGEQQREDRDRDEAQANATIEIAQAQARLQELQEQALELAVQQTEATANVVLVQQEALVAIKQELELLRSQADTLREQVTGQKQLIRSGWASGNVMEWTLFVAALAAVATVTFAVRPADDFSVAVWVAVSLL